jgi:amidase
MPVKPPTIEELERIAEAYHLHLGREDLESFRQLMGPTLSSYARLDQLSEPSLPVKYPRTSGYRPQPEENPFNAWYWRCEIRGASGGILAGKTVAIKDNICVAGVPMMNGTSVLEGFVPSIDATVVTRILEAGATIVGKSVCESMCSSGGSHTSDTGPVRNPHDPTRSTGGSSSGSAALVASRQVDLAMGGDQGGSIRIPSSWCGIYGLKPTHGLVPYTGAFPIELTLDHLGPMARSASDCALLLEAIAGPDGFDPRQRHGLVAQPYTKALTGDAKDLRLAIVQEGFGWEGLSEPDVDQCVTDSAHRFEKIGAKVSTVSIPWHRDGLHVVRPISTEGGFATIFLASGLGTNWKGHYATGLLDAFARGMRTHADDLSETVKLRILAAEYLRGRYHGHYYAKAQNLARSLTAAYDRALQDHDLLVMPSTPMKATRIPHPGCSREEYIARATEMSINTSPFDVSGHPAISMPCGTSNGLPVGMMLIGRTGEDATVLRAADAYQRSLGA